VFLDPVAGEKTDAHAPCFPGAPNPWKGAPDNPVGRAQLVYDAPRSIHGTDEPESLGKAASHGSIRVANSVATKLARMVMEAGGVGKDGAWYERVQLQPKGARRRRHPQIRSPSASSPATPKARPRRGRAPGADPASPEPRVPTLSLSVV
jgi:hypothetical protein